MDTGFEQLEQRVRKAAELVRALRARNRDLESAAGEARTRLDAAEQRLAGLEAERRSPAVDPARVDALSNEVKTMRQEREEIRRRIARILEVLDEIDAAE
jgi:hypothetical protein